MSDVATNKRRTFLAAVSGLVSSRLFAADSAPARVNDSAQLAINGGKPVRSTQLSSSYPGTQFYDDQESKSVLEVIQSRSLFRWYGPKPTKTVAALEHDLAAFVGTRYALAVTSGTAALHCALQALGAGPGDEVILPAWGWYSCYNAILLTGALPIFAEVDRSFNIDPADVEKKITPRTKAIMVIHLAGCPADMDRIMSVARQHKVRVLEDSAQTVGGRYKGKRTAGIADIGIFSFQLSKTITAGEGGAVVTSDPMLFERATRFHDLGMLRPGHQQWIGQAGMQGFVGTNYRMNEMTGAVMCAQLSKLESILGYFRRNARYVQQQIQQLPGLEMRHIPDAEGEIGLVVSFILKTKEKRDQFVKALRAENLPASPPSGSLVLPSVPYIESKVAPHPLWPSFTTAQGQAIRYGAECCPFTAEIFARTANITIGPRYSEDDLKDIVAGIKKVHGVLLV
jgi:8-amino-3,8-dideoxy-alpha-D-manno-octulosonate transaminase